MGKEAYLAGALNAAIVCEDDTCSFVHAGSGKTKVIDGYLFSQLRAIKPELRKVTYDSHEDLIEKLFVENVQQKALNQALELMDTGLSLNYRQKAAYKLLGKLEIHNGLIDFLKNRLYSRVLPETFDPAAAIVAIRTGSADLLEIYKDLREKSNMFGRFYTLFKLGVRIAADEQEVIDTVLADCSAYANFTLALFARSQTLFDFAATLSIQHAGSLSDRINEELFSQILTKLKLNYKINLNTKNWINFCDRSQHVAVWRHRFYGSPLKTMFNYYHENLPFSSGQLIKVVSRNLSYQRISAETSWQYHCRIFDQTVDEIHFLREIRIGKTTGFPASIRTGELTSYLTSRDAIDVIRNNYPMQNMHLPEIFVGVLFADNLFLNHHYNDAILAYSDIVQQTEPDRRKSSYLSDLFINTLTNVKLAVIFEKMDKNEEARELLFSVYNKLNKYGTQGAKPRAVESLRHSAKGMSFLVHEDFFPSNIDFIKSFYDSVGAFIAETDALRP